jgi:hypothetical protein
VIIDSPSQFPLAAPRYTTGVIFGKNDKIWKLIVEGIDNGRDDDPSIALLRCSRKRGQLPSGSGKAAADAFNGLYLGEEP